MKRTLVMFLVLACVAFAGICYAKVPTKGYVTANDGLNIRSSASTNANIIMAVENGTSVTITGVSGNWYKVSVGSVQGYCYASYINVTEYGDSYGDSNKTPTEVGRDLTMSAMNAQLTSEPPSVAKKQQVVDLEE